MKKTILLLVFVSSLITNLYSQDEDCSCKTDLTFLDSKIRKTPAYKINKKTYETSYSKIVKEVTSINSIFDCHSLLNELLISLNDNHSRIYSIDPGITDEVNSNSEKLSEFKKSELYNAYPKPNIDLDSLQSVLNTKTKKNIEGIYTRENYMTIGVYKNKDSYKAIILDSESDFWQIGEIMYTLIPFGDDYLLNIGGGITSKRLIAYTERIENGFFYFMGFQKDIAQKNYATKTPSEDIYKREELSNGITYLKIGSFNSWNPTLTNAEKFYKSLEGSLNKRNLIIDLRNNGGGGDRNSNILYKLVRDYAKKNKVYVLINHRTVSNAEQFASKLSMLENCQLFGKRTNGTLAYEIKDSNYTLPCNNFIAVLTSKKHSKYLEFESKGIKPKFELDVETNWIEQLKTYIENNK
ncbi:S41 family peptidase [Flavobacteriaceae bacterium]|nr:S41 family peptidase [Flavobacteriaceae bacterium]MDA9284519.1 S41 family peptidase [Flavobacteriaceae bacterium]MDB4212606.1 S41 family peptidase [Flavobacteriaceae bacterium]|tara:strand:- start:159 stop:1388 length:1230 start_codon:yes stop_codon:yes gene_type:complete